MKMGSTNQSDCGVRRSSPSENNLAVIPKKWKITLRKTHRQEETYGKAGDKLSDGNGNRGGRAVCVRVGLLLTGTSTIIVECIGLLEGRQYLPVVDRTSKKLYRRCHDALSLRP
jgi:hypothetical protein